MSFIDGIIKLLEGDSPDYIRWMRYDAIIKGRFTTTMENTLRSSVKYTNTTVKMWGDLEERLGKESAPHAYELK